MRELENGIRVVRRGVGFAAQGPGFYTWDRDARDVIENAVTLATGAEPWRPARRVYGDLGDLRDFRGRRESRKR